MWLLIWLVPNIYAPFYDIIPPFYDIIPPFYDSYSYPDIYWL